MATYTALIADVRSVGTLALSSLNAEEGPSNLVRLNHPASVARIRTVIAPHFVSSSVGGFISCDFTVPAEEAQRWHASLRYGAVVWLFDGSTPIFFGYNQQPTWNSDGSCVVNVQGPWGVLAQSRMREAWEMVDMSLLQRGTSSNENRSAQANVNSDGSLTLSIPAGTLTGNDICSVDYLLFGEVTGAFDLKQITAFEVNVVASQNLAAARHFRVTGKATATAATGDQLYDITAGTGSSGIQGAWNLNGTNQGAAAWVSNIGYRCLRFELINTAGISASIASDWYVTLDRIRISTREALFPAANATMDTGALARDVLTSKFVFNNSSGLWQAQLDYPLDFWRSFVQNNTTDQNTMVYANGQTSTVFGLDPIIGTGTAPNTGVGVNGFTSLEWQAATDILSSLAGVDGSFVGFYFPYNGRGGYDPPGNGQVAGREPGSWWLSAPPQLYYQQFADPNYSPDYTISTKEGAVVQPNTDAQPLIDTAYVNYNNIKGRQQSVVVQDTTTLNYAYAQGFQRSDDWTIQPSVSANAATSQATQALATRRQPFSGATITIENTGQARYAILKGGAFVPKLSTIRPGSFRIDDIPAGSGLRAGYGVQVEWWGQTADTPEKVQITLGPPGQPHKTRAAARVIHGYLHSRRDPFHR